jgi:hypothetical protein
MPPELHEAVVADKMHVYRELIDQARVEARWARQGLALVDALEAATAAGAEVEGHHPVP